MNEMDAMIFLTIMSVIVMGAIVAFIIHVNKQVQRNQAERHFGDLRHVKIPEDPSEIEKAPKLKPPYRPL